MKVRKLAVALALVGGLGSGVANALGLGEVELQSYLNEPLDAEIELRNTGSASPDEIFVNLAPPQVFDRVGVDRDFFLTNLQFNVTTAPNGQLVVNVTTRQAVREPYLNFLIEVTWPNGKMLREYSMLLDPPVYADKVGDNVPTQAPQTQSRPTSSATAAQPSSTTSTPAESSSASADSSGYGDTFGPTGPSDTLWGIALAVRPDESYTPQQVMLALQDMNPDAFIGDNINRLKRGQVLRIPSAEQIASRSTRQAYQEVVAQNKAFQKPQQTVDATGQAPDQAASGSAPAGDELRLVAGNDSTTAEDGASSGGAEGVAGGQEGSTDIVMEKLDKSQRENEELNSRVDDLEAQLATMQRLVELKNSQLAELQAQNGQDGESAEQSMPAESTGSESESPADAAMTEGDGSPTEGMAGGSDDAMSSTMDKNASGDMMASDEQSAEAQSPEDDASTSMNDAGSANMEAGGEMGAGPEDGSSPAASEDSAAEDGVAEEPSMGTTESGSQEPVDETAQKAETESEQPVVDDKGFFGSVIDELKSNRLYQLVAGGIAVLVLLLLGLLARRNANREKAFYDELNDDSTHRSDAIDLGDDGEYGADQDKDALSEADAYIAYGRHDQAAEVLESAISREPSRTDLRLKLLGVYADSENRTAFEKQYSELEALDDDAAVVEAQALRERLEDAESTPSIDDLESQLRSDVSGTADVSKAEATDDTFEGFDDQANRASGSDREADDDFGFDDLDLDAEDSATGAGEYAEDDARKDADAPIEYDLSDLGLDEEDVEATEATDDDELELSEDSGKKDDTGSDDLDLDFSLDEEPEVDTDDSSELSEDDFGSLELDDAFLDDKGDVTEDENRATSDEEHPSLDEEPELATDSEGNLDESFLDDLDAELEKVAGETDDDVQSGSAEDTLDDLELDVSDEDLALMEEVSETPSEDKTGDNVDADTDDLEPLADDEIPELDEELDIGDSLGSEDEDIPTADESVDEDVETDDLNTPVEESDADRKEAATSLDFDEASLDDEDDFDFLSGTDEAATKLDLARAYIEMGDADGARDILEEVAIEGSEEQKTEAQDLLKNMS